MKKIVKMRAIGVSPSRSRPACLSYHSDLHLFPPIRKLHNAADFVSVAWRSRKVFQRVYARVQRELGRASASLDIKETTPRRRRLIALIYPHSGSSYYYVYSPSSRTLSAGRLCHFPIYADLHLHLATYNIFSHPFSATNLFRWNFGDFYTIRRSHYHIFILKSFFHLMYNFYICTEKTIFLT